MDIDADPTARKTIRPLRFQCIGRYHRLANSYLFAWRCRAYENLSENPLADRR